MKMLIVEVARESKDGLGYKVREWKVMTCGIVVSRFRRAKDARRFAKNLRKLYARPGVDQAAAAALLVVGQMKDDYDLWDLDDEGTYEVADVA